MSVLICILPRKYINPYTPYAIGLYWKSVKKSTVFKKIDRIFSFSLDIPQLSENSLFYPLSFKLTRSALEVMKILPNEALSLLTLVSPIILPIWHYFTWVLLRTKTCSSDSRSTELPKWKFGVWLFHFEKLGSQPPNIRI